jgi:hypothetical protein
MEDVEHLDTLRHLDFNPADTNSSIRMGASLRAKRGKVIKGILTAAARESKCLCKRFSKCCRWNFSLA